MIVNDSLQTPWLVPESRVAVASHQSAHGSKHGCACAVFASVASEQKSSPSDIHLIFQETNITNHARYCPSHRTCNKANADSQPCFPSHKQGHARGTVAPEQRTGVFFPSWTVIIWSCRHMVMSSHVALRVPSNFK